MEFLCKFFLLPGWLMCGILGETFGIKMLSADEIIKFISLVWGCLELDVQF